AAAAARRRCRAEVRAHVPAALADGDAVAAPALTPRYPPRAPMVVATYLLAALAVLRAADSFCCHRLAPHLPPYMQARAELVAARLRGPVGAVLFAVVPNARCEGHWFVALLGVLALDLLLWIVDVCLEVSSRRELGGLPRGEALLHLLLAIGWGALVHAVL